MVANGVYFNGVKTTYLKGFKFSKNITSVGDSCTINLSNPGGVANAVTSYFQDIKIYTGSGTLVWRGLVYDINQNHDGTITIEGSGYIRVLMNRFHTGTFTTTSRSAIVESLVDTYGKSITTVSYITASGDSITRTLKALSVYDAIVDLANEIGYDFWVDNDLEFHFEPRSSVSSGVTIDYSTGVVLGVDVPNEASTMYNKVYVYGDKAAAGGQPVTLVESRASQVLYNVVKEHEPILDNTLKTEDECYARGMSIIDGGELVEGTITIETFGKDSLPVGQTLILSNFSTQYNVPNGTYLVLEISYLNTKKAQKIKLAKYDTNTSDQIADLIKRMRKREYNDLDDSVVATNIQALYDDISLSGTIVLEKFNIGQSFITGHPVNGIGGLTANNIVTGMSGTSTTTEINGADIMIVDAGLNLIRDWIAWVSVVAPSHGAIGTGTGAVLAGNTTLGTEVFRDTLYSKSRPTSKQVRFITQITSTEGNGSTVTEHGILNAASVGTLLCRHVHTGIVKVNTFELRYQVLISLADV